MDTLCPGFTVATLCSGPELCLLRGAVSVGVAVGPCPHLVGPPAKLLGAGYQDPRLLHLPPLHTGTLTPTVGAHLPCKTGRLARVSEVETGGQVS